MGKTSLKRFTDTLPPAEISAELRPIIESLGIAKNCRQLAEQGWTVLESANSQALNARLRDTILALAGESGGANMLLHKDPVFAAAVLLPELLAIAEFSVGRGFLLSQVAASVRQQGSPSIGLHADHNWLPAPFPAHNMLLTACWACDDYTQENGATLIIPGSAATRRHPTDAECAELNGAIPIECSAGSIAIWDGNVWHSNYPRETTGKRVVCHITYSRLMMRPVENYRTHRTELIDTYGDNMAQLLGEADFLDSPNGADYSKLIQTFNNAKR